jgi:hypothetical protein
MHVSLATGLLCEYMQCAVALLSPIEPRPTPGSRSREENQQQHQSPAASFLCVPNERGQPLRSRTAKGTRIPAARAPVDMFYASLR